MGTGPAKGNGSSCKTAENAESAHRRHGIRRIEAESSIGLPEAIHPFFAWIALDSAGLREVLTPHRVEIPEALSDEAQFQNREDVLWM